MTTRFLPATLLGLAIAVAVGACGDDSSNVGYAYGAGGSSYASTCSQYTTCGSCTPVAGCGWCFDLGGGSCATDPDSCGDASEFTWTWEPSGCPGVDASVVPPDAAAWPEASTRDAGSD
jgi:hypothetical protein